ncbi:helix-turn-helix domain-containing protein [Bosea sp. RCC_152_1]|uniref:winged helix-turn-helix domain-containing protein n=1 Tax=Bosea sp. RCC_152_1 TaxID=3239228 RepID=UPI00352423D8
MDLSARLEALEAENDRLRDRCEFLEEAMGLTVDAPVFLGLTKHEARLFGALLKRPMLTKTGVMATLYSERPDEEPEMKIVDVYVCKIRKKLKPYGLEIETIWGQGYRMTEAMRAKAAALIETRISA